MTEKNSPAQTESTTGEPDARTRTQRHRERWIATVLVFCIAIVGFWEVMAHRSDRPFTPFELIASDFDSFEPISTRWFIESLPVRLDPIEPNVLMCRLRPQVHPSDSVAFTQPMLLRLVHGFNLVDCMVEKGHTVELLASTRTDERFEGGIRLPDAISLSGQKVQVWRVVSPVGDVSLWVSTMLRAGDFEQTNVDTRAMPFPRVPYPERVGWTPRGLTLEGIKHPVQGLKKYMEYKWNSARGDVLTLIELKQEAWASEDELTLVTMSIGPSIDRDAEQQVLHELLSAHVDLHRQLKKWRVQDLDLKSRAER